MTKIRLSRGQKQMVEVGAGAGLVVGMVTIGIVIGGFGKYLLNKARGWTSSFSTEGTLFSGEEEDSIIQTAKKL